MHCCVFDSSKRFSFEIAFCPFEAPSCILAPHKDSSFVRIYALSVYAYFPIPTFTHIIRAELSICLHANSLKHFTINDIMYNFIYNFAYNYELKNAALKCVILLLVKLMSIPLYQAKAKYRPHYIA